MLIKVVTCSHGNTQISELKDRYKTRRTYFGIDFPQVKHSYLYEREHNFPYTLFNKSKYIVFAMNVRNKIALKWQ